MIEFIVASTVVATFGLGLVFSPFWVPHIRRRKALRELEAMGFVVDRSPSRTERRGLVERVSDVIPAVGVFGIRWIAKGAVDGHTIVVFEHLQYSVPLKRFSFKTIIIAEFVPGSRFNDPWQWQAANDVFQGAFTQLDRGGVERQVIPRSPMTRHVPDSRLILESNDLPLVGETAEYIRRCAKMVGLYEA